MTKVPTLNFHAKFPFGSRHCLKDVIHYLDLDPSIFPHKVSPKWKCIISPIGNSPLEMLCYMDRRIPAFNGGKECTRPIDEDLGHDGFNHFYKNRESLFKNPKIGVRGRWGVPGCHIMNDADYAIVEKTSDVFNSDTKRPVNLQMFHGPQAAKLDASTDIKVYSRLIKWPIHEAFNYDSGKIQKEIEDIFEFSSDTEDRESGTTLESMSTVVSNATRFSRRGALTGWHLDDSGEFVSQQALCADVDTIEDVDQHLSSDGKTYPMALGVNGNPLVKLFIYFPRESYSLIFDDEKTFETSYFHGLDILNAKCENLPSAEYLPDAYVCLLEAGGMAMSSPPNIPHMVLTLQTCVIAEQRRLSKLFLDEPAYLQDVIKNWPLPPILYPALLEQYTDCKYVKQFLVEPLLMVLTDTKNWIREENVQGTYRGEPISEPSAKVDVTADSELVYIYIEYLRYRSFICLDSILRYGFVKGESSFGKTFNVTEELKEIIKNNIDIYNDYIIQRISLPSQAPKLLMHDEPEYIYRAKQYIYNILYNTINSNYGDSHNEAVTLIPKVVRVTKPKDGIHKFDNVYMAYEHADYCVQWTKGISSTN